MVIETDHNEFNETERSWVNKEIEGVDEPTAMEEDDDETKETYIRGPVPEADGKWASVIRVLNTEDQSTTECVELGFSEAAISVATVAFHDRGGEVFIVVGIAEEMKLHPKSAKNYFINVYRLLEDRLQLLHKTPVEDIPRCLVEFKGHGRLLAGVGKTLRMYDLGKKKLLKKCENKSFPTCITHIEQYEDRIYVSDMAESVHFVKFRRLEQTLSIFADDTVPRWSTASCLVDYDTVAGADKFGSIYILRVPTEVSDDVDNPTGTSATMRLLVTSFINPLFLFYYFS